MKKIVFLFLLLSHFSWAQISLPADVIGAEEYNDSNFDKTEVWTDLGPMYSMIFAQTPVGVKHLFDRLKVILKENNLQIAHPTVDKSLLASYVKDLEDYENIDLSIRNGGSEIDQLWRVGTSKFIAILLNSERYTILITK